MKNMKRLKPRFMRHFIPFLIAALIIAGIVSWFVYGMVRKHYEELAIRHAYLYDLEVMKFHTEDGWYRKGDFYNYYQFDLLASEYLEMQEHISGADKHFFEDARKIVDRLSFDGTVYYSFVIDKDTIFITSGGFLFVNGEDGTYKTYTLDYGDFYNWYVESDEVVKGSIETYRKMFALMESGRETSYDYLKELNLYRDIAADEIHKKQSVLYQDHVKSDYESNHTESVFENFLEPEKCVVHAYDIYVKDGMFVPGKVGLFDPEGNLVKEYDFTPKDLFGFEHIISGDEVQFLDVYNFSRIYRSEYKGNIVLYNQVPERATSILMAKYTGSWADRARQHRIFVERAADVDETYFDEEFDGLGWSVEAYYISIPSLFQVYPVRMAAMVGGIFLLFIGIAAWIAGQRYKSAKAAYQLVGYRIKLSNAMAHDLKTPLATLSAYAENLKEEQDPEKMRKYADSILTTVGSANHLVEDILNFSRSEADSIKICKEEVNLRELILSCIEEHKNGFQANGIEITTDGSDITLHTDRKILAQAINNLILNCAKYSAKGTAEIKWDKKSLTISNPTDLEISDVNKLKKPFVKGEDSRNTGGTGLGLAIADNNLEMLGYEMKLSIEDHRFIVTVNF